MTQRSIRLLLALTCLTILSSTRTLMSFAHGDTVSPNVIQSVADGKWTESATWNGGQVPTAGDTVLIRSEHEVVYDSTSDKVIRSIHVSGTLRFRTDADTRLDVGLIRIEAGDHVVEEGFNCDVHESHSHDSHHHSSGSQSALIVGTQSDPVAAGYRCLIRLHSVPGVDDKSWPAIVCCRGRMEIHGAPMERTWVKLARTADAGATRLFLSDEVTNWNAGDRLLITGTARQEPIAGIQTEHVSEASTSEVRFLTEASDGSASLSMAAGSRQRLTIDCPLDRTHRGDEYSAEIANLSRNVVIESADPENHRGHTMYHYGSIGSISYAEFRHLGKEGVLGRYPIHFHLVADSMRGNSVIGASVWDSNNRWVTIHGTQYLVVRDCVGFQSVGHGFFLEDGTETHNVLDRNLAVHAYVGEPLPEQVLPFDRNDGAGFWWANSLNAFTRNVATECDQHGFRFEAEASDKFDPRLSIMQADGSRKRQDVRTLPFIRFSDNETHTQRRFGLNLGGIRGLTYGQFESERSRETNSDSVSGTVAGVGPNASHPMIIERFKAWDSHWAFHTYCPSAMVKGMDVFDCNYGIWRSVMDLHQYDDLSFREIHSHATFFPMGGYGPKIEMGADRPSFPNYSSLDEFPPLTVITQIEPLPNGDVMVCGTSIDNTDVVRVEVNGKAASSVRDGFAEWEVIVAANDAGEFVASSVDNAGNDEVTPHRLRPAKSRIGTQSHHAR